MSTKKINVGIAGLGRSGWGIHAHLLRTLPRKYRIAAVFDRDPGRSSEAHAEFGSTIHKSYRSLVCDPDVDLVIVTTPNKLHADSAIEAMKAGKNVVCEKPMATSLKDADRMIACSRKTGQLLAIFQSKRYSPDFLAVKKVLESGKLGRVVQIRITSHSFGRRWDWQTLKKNGGGTLNNTGPHPIDQALVLFGDSRPKVFCLRDRVLTLGDADDHVQVILYGRNAPTVEVEITAACAYPRDAWLVMGSQGSLSGTAQEIRWKYFNPSSLPPRQVDERPTSGRSYNSEKIKMIEKSWSASTDKSPNQLGFYIDLYKTLTAGAPLVITPESVRRQMWVMEQCRKMAPLPK